MLQVSTGFKTLILGPYSFMDIFERGAIKVYAGFRPPTADGEEPAVSLGKITIGGNPWSPSASQYGLQFSQSGPYITKVPYHQWLFTVERSGIPTWGRLVGEADDDGLVSYTMPRIDFSITADPAEQTEMLLPQANVIVGQRVSVGSFLFTIPPVVSP